MSEGKECGMSRAQQHWQGSGLGSGGRFGCVLWYEKHPWKGQVPVSAGPQQLTVSPALCKCQVILAQTAGKDI